MDNITVEAFYSKLPEETMQSVMEALAAKEWFGLKGKKSIVVFCPVDLKSYWVTQAGAITANYDYQNEQTFIDGIKMQLTSHREFISRQRLLDAVNKKLPT